jgi:hypothetical protein
MGAVNNKLKIMGLIKKYYVLIFIILTVAILVLIRSFSAKSFRQDAKRWYEPSVNGLNIISEKDADSLKGEKLIIDLGDSGTVFVTKFTDLIHIPADSILENKCLRKIRDHQGAVLLYSSSISLAARSWTLLSQMGIKNLYILTSDSDNEAPKYKFRPDTTIRPE